MPSDRVVDFPVFAQDDDPVTCGCDEPEARPMGDCGKCKRLIVNEKVDDRDGNRRLRSV